MKHLQINNYSKNLARDFILQGHGSISDLNYHYQHGITQEHHQFGFSFVQHCVRFSLELVNVEAINIITQRLVHATSSLNDKHFMYAMDKFLMDLPHRFSIIENKESLKTNQKISLSLVHLLNIKDVLSNSPLSTKKLDLSISLLKGYIDNHPDNQESPTLIQKKHLRLVHHTR